jgi:hypothetical protein
MISIASHSFGEGHFIDSSVVDTGIEVTDEKGCGVYLLRPRDSNVSPPSVSAPSHQSQDLRAGVGKCGPFQGFSKRWKGHKAKAINGKVRELAAKGTQ